MYTYAEAIKQQESEYLRNLATGRFRPATFPWPWLNCFLLFNAIYTASTRRSRNARDGDLLLAFGIEAESFRSLLNYRSPCVIGSVVVGLNACMCTVSALNFLVLRDPRDIKRAHLSMRNSSNEGERRNNDDAADVQKWQPIPDYGWLRLWWTLDLVACLRALKWSWNPQGVSSDFPKPVQDLSGFYKRHVVRFVCGYLALDILKCIMIGDAHFYGYINPQAPSALEFLPLWALHVYRVLLAAAAFFCSVQYFGSGWTLLQVGTLGPRYLGINGLSYMYPPLFGSLAAVLTHGLKGFWSHTWHQIFRAHLSSIGDEMASWLVPDTDSERSHALRARLFAVFFVSGILHACASYTLLGPSNPMISFLCFAVQPFSCCYKPSYLRSCALVQTI